MSTPPAATGSNLVPVAPPATPVAGPQPPANPKMHQRTLSGDGTLVPLQPGVHKLHYAAHRKVQVQLGYEIHYEHDRKNDKVSLDVKGPTAAASIASLALVLQSQTLPVEATLQQAALAQTEAERERLKRAVSDPRKRTSYTLQEKYDHALAASGALRRIGADAHTLKAL